MGKFQKNGHKNFKKNVKIKSPNFWKNHFFLESYNTECGNDDSTHDLKYTRSYMRSDFISCQKIVPYMTMPKCWVYTRPFLLWILEVKTQS